MQQDTDILPKDGNLHLPPPPDSFGETLGGQSLIESTLDIVEKEYRRYPEGFWIKLAVPPEDYEVIKERLLAHRSAIRFVRVYPSTTC